jgi:hypothetical protein
MNLIHFLNKKITKLVKKMHFLILIFVSLSVLVIILSYSSNYIRKLDLISKFYEIKVEKNNCSSSNLKCNCSSNFKIKPNNPYSYLTRYPFILDCKNTYNGWNSSINPNSEYDYRSPVSEQYHSARITRGVVMFFPLDKIKRFRIELKWLYRSWTHMLKHQPCKWRTDLIIFVENDKKSFEDEDFFMNKLNCSFNNRRLNDLDNSRCVLIEYTPIKKRKIRQVVNTSNIAYDYRFFLEKFDIFSKNETESIPFYNFLITNVGDYHSADSILPTFDGYEYFKSANYDYLLKSDIDTFLTPLFG